MAGKTWHMILKLTLRSLPRALKPAMAAQAAPMNSTMNRVRNWMRLKVLQELEWFCIMYDSSEQCCTTQHPKGQFFQPKSSVSTITPPLTTSTVTFPVAKTPKSTLPLQSSYPAFVPVFDTATLSKFKMAGLYAPACGTGAATETIGADDPCLK